MTLPDPKWRSATGEPIACVEKLKVLRENLAEIRQMCQDALEDAVLMGCDEGQVRQILIELIASLENPYRGNDCTVGGIPMLRIQNIREGIADRDKLHHVSGQLSGQYRRTVLSGGEIVMSLVGTIGVTAIVPDTLRGANVHRNLAVIAPGEQIVSAYLSAYLASSHCQKLLRRETKGGNQALLNLGDLSKIPVPIPPLPLQSKFANRVTEIRELQTQQAASRNRLDDLFQSMLHRAFNGEL